MQLTRAISIYPRKAAAEKVDFSYSCTKFSSPLVRLSLYSFFVFSQSFILMRIFARRAPLCVFPFSNLRNEKWHLFPALSRSLRPDNIIMPSLAENR